MNTQTNKDYHTPWNLTAAGFKPKKKKKREYEIKHNKWVKYGLKIMKAGFVKVVDHFENIYRLIYDKHLD